MNCPACHNSVAPNAAFCGTCGQALRPPATTSQAMLHHALAQPPAMQPPSAIAAAQGVQLVSPANQPPANAGDAHVNPQAIAALVFGVLGCAGWLIPIFGVILGLLAIIFGSIGIKSQKPKLAKVGIGLAIPVIAISLYVWIEAAKQLAQENTAPVTTQKSNEADLQTITTPCYATRLPRSMTVDQESAGCAFKATDTAAGDLYQVKVMDISRLDASNIKAAAKADADNLVSIIQGSAIDSEWDTSFVGSPGYGFTMSATDGSAATVKYIYHISAEGNLVIVFHSNRNGTDFDLGTIENNWYWR